MPAVARSRYLPAALAAILLASLRLCHIRLLWADEDYHLAAALNLLHGKWPYRDFWYDKPPLNAFYYLLIGGHAAKFSLCLSIARLRVSSCGNFRSCRLDRGRPVPMCSASVIRWR